MDATGNSTSVKALSEIRPYGSHGNAHKGAVVLLLLT
jgi:hypothetical protein